LIGFTARAARQFLELRQHYEAKGRIDAIRGLIEATQEASRKIEQNQPTGSRRPAPIRIWPGRAVRGSRRVGTGYLTAPRIHPLLTACFTRQPIFRAERSTKTDDHTEA